MLKLGIYQKIQILILIKNKIANLAKLLIYNKQ